MERTGSEETFSETSIWVKVLYKTKYYYEMCYNDLQSQTPRLFYRCKTYLLYKN